MGILKQAGDLVYTIRFLTLLVTPFEKTKAFEAGIIDQNGKRKKDFSMNTIDNRKAYRDYYTPFHRLVFNIKRLIPGGKIGTYASALYLIKEKFSVSERKINKALNEVGVDSLDFLAENTEWFVMEDKQLSPGVYRVRDDKVLNANCEDMVRRYDRIRVAPDCFPIGDIFGLDVYEATHMPTNQKIYVTIGELSR